VLIEAGAVDHVCEPDAAFGEHGVAGPGEPVVFGNPLEAVLELGETKLHGKTIARGT
jgi:hypothetical protein